MPGAAFAVEQNVFKHAQPRITVVTIEEHELPMYLPSFVESIEAGTIGIAAAYDKCQLVMLALASGARVFLVRLATGGSKNKSQRLASPGRQALRRLLLEAAHIRKAGFNADRLVLSLYMDLALRVKSLVDLRVLARNTKKSGWGSLDAIAQALGGWEVLGDKHNVVELFRSEKYQSNKLEPLAMRSWASHRAAVSQRAIPILEQALAYDTVDFHEANLNVLAVLKRDLDRLDALKPTIVKNDVATEHSLKSGNINIQMTRFKTRMRPSQTQTLTIETKTADGKTTKHDGRTLGVKGKSASVGIRGGGKLDGTISSVFTIGKDDPTNAEGLRALVITLCLRQSISLLQNPLVQAIWLPERLRALPAVPSSSVSDSPLQIHFPPRPLNTSQTEAVNAMLSNEKPHTIIHGGPGTGKTTVIAAATMSILVGSPKRTLWLVAQSNVAVKNIAEKLVDCDIDTFALLVSQDFHFEWHEHIYHKIEHNVIRTDTLEKHIVGVERQLSGARVVLCTLSMLSNPKISECGLTKLVPIETVVVDEASQIEVGDYLPLFHQFGSTLRKLIYIGDDKQLPPYGQEDIPSLKSIFEMKHLRRDEIFLDTQYRMPHPIGLFISHHMYNKRLKTDHALSELSTCRFIDVPGVETSCGHSWINMKEVQAVIHIARRYQEQGKSYRIVTPYDAQRGRLEEALKSAKLNWEDKVFNVDSFQGNEDDHIIISAVRTKKVGFLQNLRRNNVMLTRCKKSMVICTNRTFLTTNKSAQKTLLGKMAATWGAAGWISWTQLLAGHF